MDDVLRIAVIGMGILLLAVDFMALVYRKITESIGLCWCFLGIVLIMLGAVPGLCAWTETVPKEAVPALLLAGAAFLMAAFYLSSRISQLLRKNQELAMHVSLLNQENEGILEELKEMKEMKELRGTKGSQGHEDTIRH